MVYRCDTGDKQTRVGVPGLDGFSTGAGLLPLESMSSGSVSANSLLKKLTGQSANKTWMRNIPISKYT